MWTFTEVRIEIDAIDEQLLDLFARRMELASDVAASKLETGKAIFDPVRERQVLADVARRAPEGLEDQAVSLFSLLMSMNKAAQLEMIEQQEARCALSPHARVLSAARDGLPRRRDRVLPRRRGGVQPDRRIQALRRARDNLRPDVSRRVSSRRER